MTRWTFRTMSDGELDIIAEQNADAYPTRWCPVAQDDVECSCTEDEHWDAEQDARDEAERASRA